MAQPIPEPTEPVHDAVFAQLKADVLEGLAEADGGMLLSSEETWESIRAHQRGYEEKLKKPWQE